MFLKGKKAFTLIELLVVISIIGLLTAIMIPALAAARQQAISLLCKSNIRQLALANIGYASENDGFFVPAAADMWDNFGGMNRWHGKRDNENEPFDPLKSPLVSYLGSGKIKECPSKVNFEKGQTWNQSFEKGCGGYGYNMIYIGSRLWQRNYGTGPAGWKRPYCHTTRISEIRKPARTLMFADTGFVQNGTLIEYSFAEPPFFVMNGYLLKRYAKPSIHFRHRGSANIAWADGSVSSQKIAEFNKKAQSLSSYNTQLGWFEPLDNSLFDIE